MEEGLANHDGHNGSNYNMIIQACNPPVRKSGVDHLSWKWMAAGKFSMLVTDHLACSSKTEQRWQRPDSSWFKINIDGSVSKNNTKAAIGGAVQNSDGEWLMDFNMVTEMDEIFKIEAQTIVEGMKLAWLKGYKQVEINCDNAMLIDTIHNGFASISNIVEVWLIQEMCNKD
ncbi:hypothetical protein Gotur_000795 [Gossypium turneri]